MCHPAWRRYGEGRPVFGVCSYCDEDILDGDGCVECDGLYYHEDCFSDAAPGILLRRHGATTMTAEVERNVGIGF